MNKLTSGGRFVSFKRGDILIEPNSPEEGLMLESKGLTRVYSKKNGIPLPIINGLWEVSLMRYFGQGKNLVVEAVTSGEMRIWNKKESQDFLEKEKEILAELMANLAEFTALLLTGNARQKVAAVIAQASEKGADSGLAHKIIAGITGLTRETVTLQMIKLEKEGIIDNRNRMVRIVHPEKLKEIIKG